MRLLVLVAAAIVALSVTATAAADGLPVLGIDVGSQGVTVSGSQYRYVTINDAAVTIVERIARNGGRVDGITRVAGNFTIPAVAYDSSASGLSANGTTLVLIEPRATFPRSTTTFALLDARTLRIRRIISLRGDFSFDAISPRGRKMFLINYTSSFDPTRYTVRAYDLQADTLLPKAIIDPAERSDKMRGEPMTRLVSADGRWAYTLYNGAGGEPFVHALDTSTSTAHCIDLPMLMLANLSSVRLTLGPGTQVSVGSTDKTFAVIDTKTFAATEPIAHASSNLVRRLILGAALAGLSLLAVASLAMRRRVRGRPATA